MRYFFITGIALLFSGVMGLLSGCAIVDVKNMSYKELTACAASSGILRHAVACSEELEKRHEAKPKPQKRPETKKVQRIVALYGQANHGGMPADV